MFLQAPPPQSGSLSQRFLALAQTLQFGCVTPKGSVVYTGAVVSEMPNMIQHRLFTAFAQY